MKWRLLDLGTINPRSYKELLNFEILERQVDRIIDTVLILSPPPFIWIGTDITPEEAVNLDVAKAEGIPVVETLIIGGALILENNFIWNFIGKSSSIIPLEYAWQLLKFAQVYALRSFGLKVEMTEKNDLLINDKKLVGISFASAHDLLVSDSTMNITFNYELADRILTEAGKEGKDLKTWVTSLNDELNRQVSYKEVADNLKRALKRRFKVDLVEEKLTAREQAVIRAGEQMRESFLL